MTKILDHDDGGFNETQKRNSDEQIGTDINYDESNMAVAPALDFLYAMRTRVGGERKLRADDAIKTLESFDPDIETEVSEEAYGKNGSVNPEKAVQLLENETKQLEQINDLTDGEIEEEYEALEQAYETVEEVYSERFEQMRDFNLTLNPSGPYLRDRQKVGST